MRKKIICTLGPSSLRPDVIARFEERGVDLFRINLSHTPLDQLEATIDFLQRESSTPICLDTEGAQVRCGTMTPSVRLEEGRTVRLVPADVVGTAEELGLHPSSIFSELRPGTVITIDFDGASLRVIEACNEGATALVVEGGRVGSNKAVSVDPPPGLPALTDKDVLAIELGTRRGIRHFALSFARSAEDVAQVRALAFPRAHIIAKIESRAGVQNVDRIAAAADALLIDRGDLSREIPIELVPLYQKHIIRRANAMSRQVFVATNLLESMIAARKPTIAEANDIFNTLLDGAHGLVLAAETAIGQYPVPAVDMVLQLLDAFERSTSTLMFDGRPKGRVA